MVPILIKVSVQKIGFHTEAYASDVRFFKTLQLDEARSEERSVRFGYVSTGIPG